MIGDEMAEQLGARGVRKRFGTFFYGETNVGDDVQTIAQLGCLSLDQDLIAFNRDEVATCAGDRRIFVMNGWLGNFRRSPSLRIDPAFISYMAGKDLARRGYADYYRRHQPIGCRDRTTGAKLKKIGVEAFLSGCLTNPYRAEERGGYAVVVDVHLESNGTS